MRSPLGLHSCFTDSCGVQRRHVYWHVHDSDRRTPHGSWPPPGRRGSRPVRQCASRAGRVPLRGPAPGQDRHQGRHGERLRLSRRARPRSPSHRTTPPSRSPTATTSPRSAAAPDPTAFRKNCQLNLIVHVPAGFTYAIASVDYRGFASLQRGASGMEKASYYFQGSPSTASRTHPFNGPLRRQLAGHRRAPTGPNWCGRPAESSATSTSTPSCGSPGGRRRPAPRAS